MSSGTLHQIYSDRISFCQNDKSNKNDCQKEYDNQCPKYWKTVEKQKIYSLNIIQITSFAKLNWWLSYLIVSWCQCLKRARDHLLPVFKIL